MPEFGTHPFFQFFSKNKNSILSFCVVLCHVMSYQIVLWCVNDITWHKQSDSLFRPVIRLSSSKKHEASSATFFRWDEVVIELIVLLMSSLVYLCHITNNKKFNLCLILWNIWGMKGKLLWSHSIFPQFKL